MKRIAQDYKSGNSKSRFHMIDEVPVSTLVRVKHVV